VVAITRRVRGQTSPATGLPFWQPAPAAKGKGLPKRAAGDGALAENPGFARDPAIGTRIALECQQVQTYTNGCS
jgi:hypothetical protein